MEPRKIVRLLPNGGHEEVLAIDLQAGDRFIDDVRKQEGIVVEQLNEGGVKYRTPEGTLFL